MSLAEDNMNPEQRVPGDASDAPILDAIEPWLYIVLAVVMTPSLSRLIVRMVSGPNPGELGFGGIAFLMAGFAVAVVTAISAIVVLRFYVRDDYRLRWSVNVGAVAIALVVLIA
jgi:hypothetical protein